MCVVLVTKRIKLNFYVCSDPIVPLFFIPIYIDSCSRASMLARMSFLCVREENRKESEANKPQWSGDLLTWKIEVQELTIVSSDFSGAVTTMIPNQVLRQNRIGRKRRRFTSS